MVNPSVSQSPVWRVIVPGSPALAPGVNVGYEPGVIAGVSESTIASNASVLM